MNGAFVGIDPGKDSYITVIEPSKAIVFHPIPMIGKEIDVQELNEILVRIGSEYSEVVVVIENVHAIHGSAAEATFDFGKTVGILEALLVANKLPFTKVQPKTWQKEMWEGVPIQKKASSTGKTQVNDTKAISEMAAKRLFPNEDLRPNDCTARCKKSDHNKVDSLLIAEYCRRKFKSN